MATTHTTARTIVDSKDAHLLTQFAGDAKVDAPAHAPRHSDHREHPVYNSGIPGRHAQARAQTQRLATAYNETRSANAAASVADERTRFEDAMATIPEDRQVLLRRVRAQMLNGGYNTDAKLDTSLDDMLDHFDRNSTV